MVIYKVYTTRNLADTTRDPDDIVINELSYFQRQKNAIEFAQEYIKRHFVNVNTKLILKENEWYEATDFCSYGQTIYVRPILLQ